MSANSPYEVDNNLVGKLVTLTDPLGTIGDQSFTITANDDDSMTVTEEINPAFKTAIDADHPIYYKVITSSEPLLNINVTTAGFPASKILKQKAYLEKELQDKFVPANLSLLLNLNIG